MASSGSSTPPKRFDISQLPSLKHGMTAEEESKLRRQTCRFIEEAGKELKLPRIAVATAMVFFHRFYAKHSFQEHHRFEVAVATILLAAKTEESPRKLNVVIDECYKLKQRASGSPNARLDPKGDEFMKLKERILRLERVILHTIGFELSIDHPYKFLVEQIKTIVRNRQLEYISPSSSSLRTSETLSKMVDELVPYAMNFANDSMQTSLCLQFPSQEIATACVYLSAHFAKVRPANKKSWLEVLGLTDAQALASISIQTMELITDKKKGEIEMFKKIRAELEKLTSKDNNNNNAARSAAKRTPPPPRPPAPDAKKQRT